MPEQIVTQSGRRYVVLGGPGGRLTVRPIGCPMIADRYRSWQALAQVNVPRSIPKRWGYPDQALVRELQAWALRTFEVV